MTSRAQSAPGHPVIQNRWNFVFMSNALSANHPRGHRLSAIREARSESESGGQKIVLHSESSFEGFKVRGTAGRYQPLWHLQGGFCLVSRLLHIDGPSVISRSSFATRHEAMPTYEYLCEKCGHEF